MMSASIEDVLAYFTSRSNRFKNIKGMELGLTAGNELWTYFPYATTNEDPWL
jgi:hypothetical protein